MPCVDFLHICCFVTSVTCQLWSCGILVCIRLVLKNKYQANFVKRIELNIFLSLKILMQLTKKLHIRNCTHNAIYSFLYKK